jgi:hypothetical protein
MPPFRRQVDDERHVGPGLIDEPLAAGQASSVVAEEKDDRIFIEPLPPEIVEKHPDPCVDVLRPLHMKREVRPDFRNVGHVRRQFQPRRIKPFEGEIPPLVGMIGTDAPHVGGHRVEYGKKRLVLLPRRVVVCRRRTAAVPHGLIVTQRIVVGFGFVGAVISRRTHIVGQKNSLRRGKPAAVPLHAESRGVASGDDARPGRRALGADRMGPHILDAGSGQTVDRGRGDMPVAVTAEIIRTRVFDRKP